MGDTMKNPRPIPPVVNIPPQFCWDGACRVCALNVSAHSELLYERFPHEGNVYVTIPVAGTCPSVRDIIYNAHREATPSIVMCTCGHEAHVHVCGFGFCRGTVAVPDGQTIPCECNGLTPDATGENTPYAGEGA